MIFLFSGFALARFSKCYHPITAISVILGITSLLLLISIVTGDYKPDLFASVATMGLCFSSGYFVAMALILSNFNDASCYEEIHDALGEAIEELKKHGGQESTSNLDDIINRFKDRNRSE